MYICNCVLPRPPINSGIGGFGIIYICIYDYLYLSSYYNIYTIKINAWRARDVLTCISLFDEIIQALRYLKYSTNCKIWPPLILSKVSVELNIIDFVFVEFSVSPNKI